MVRLNIGNPSFKCCGLAVLHYQVCSDADAYDYQAIIRKAIAYRCLHVCTHAGIEVGDITAWILDLRRVSMITEKAVC